MKKFLLLILFYLICLPCIAFAKSLHIRVSFPAHPHYDIAIQLLPEFTKQTGIKVTVDQLQYQNMRAKQALELSKPVGDYDLLAYVVTSRPDYIAMGKLSPLKTFFQDPDLAMQDYHPKDLIAAYVDNIGVKGYMSKNRTHFTDDLYGLPFGAETSILGYRTDILKKYSLEPPQNYNDLLEQACFLHQKELGIAGITSRGTSGHHLTHAFLLHLAPLGGRILDANMKPIFNNASGIKAAQVLKKILSCAPYGVQSFGFGEMKNSFLQGKSVFFLDSTIIAGETRDPKKSKVIDKIGWVPHPMGIKKASQTGGFGLAIPNNSHHPKAAFLLMQWLTSPKIDKKIALMGGNPSRYSSHKDPEVLAKYPYMALFGKALKHADPDWRPIIPEWNEINKKIGTELSKAYTGQQTITQALDNATNVTYQILLQAGYYDEHQDS